MSSVGIAVNSKEFWKGTDLIEKKLGSVLDRKVASSTKQVFVNKIEFKEASKPDPFYQQLKKKYKPINREPLSQQNGISQVQSNNKDTKQDNKVSKDELPAPKHVLFERNKVHLQWKTTRSVGPGLFNLGNTCFLNSVIQVLTYTPPLVNYLATQEHSRTCAAVGFCMLCELQRHVLRTFTHNQSQAIKPLAILNKLKSIAKHLRFGQQEDSHEFLRYVIDGMMKSCLAKVSDKLDVYSKATTMVHQVFGGYYRSSVTCEKCHHTSNTYDPLMEVLLDIKHAHSVVNALHKLVSVELLNGDNLYLCPRCKRKVPAKKNLRVHQAPNVMTMCLKRFDSHSFFASKINKDISYPEVLNLRPFMSKNQGLPVHYKLYAVLVHSGYSCNSGHYYCFIKASNNNWYQMNDSSVHQVKLKTVLDQQAYLLFYIKDNSAIQKEKPSATQQPVRPSCTNGNKPQGFNKKEHLPKVISEPTKKADKTPIQQFPKKPEASSTKPNIQTNKQVNSRPTSIPQHREKIAFTLNHGAQQKKPNTSHTETSETNADKADNLKPETKSSKEQTESHDEELQINKVSSSVEETDKDRTNVGNDKQHENKDTAKEVKSSHKTTQWKVTNKNELLPAALLPGVLHPGDRERTPSMSSEVSHPGSVASKTGEWSMSDRSAAQEMGPRLPERQHPGWNESTVETPTKEKSSENTGRIEQTTKESEPTANHKKSKKRKRSKEKHERNISEDDTRRLLSDECREESEDERRRGKMKRLEKLKKAKKRKSGQDSSSEDEPRERRRKHKKNKKKKKHKREKVMADESSSKSERKSSERSVCETDVNEADFNSSREHLLAKSENHSDNSEKKSSRRRESKNDKKHLKSGQILREKTHENKMNKDAIVSEDVDKTESNEQTVHCSEKTEYGSSQNKSKENDKSFMPSKGEDRFGTKSTKKIDVAAKSVIEKSKDVQGKLSENRKKDKAGVKPLVAYSDDSSEDGDCRGESKMRGDTSGGNRGEKDTTKRMNLSSSQEELSRENRKGRKNVVDTLLGNSEKSSNYGRRVERWDGEKEEIPVTKQADESRKRRRDYWDEEYDRGKEKRTKNKDRHHINHSHNNENSFQREYDRKRMRNDSRHTSSSNGWYKRSHDRHPWRERR